MWKIDFHNQSATMKVVLYHKPDTQYDDVTGERYHFPQQYLSRVEAAIDDWIVYYGPEQGRPGRYYSGIAKVKNVRADQNIENHYYADLIDYIDFDEAVEYRKDGGFERSLVREDGTINGGVSMNAVRKLHESEFAKIVDAGLSQPDEWPDRYDDIESNQASETNEIGFGESPQIAFIGQKFERPVIEQLTRRKWRDSKFKQHIRRAYDRRCAFTGLRLINGKGRPEVEAAHIRPIEKGGNDWVRNGIALSGTVHWMFDRGLLSISDSFKILKSRHLNHDVSHLLSEDLTARVPLDKHLQPHPEYLNWHREHIFKE